MIDHKSYVATVKKIVDVRTCKVCFFNVSVFNKKAASCQILIGELFDWIEVRFHTPINSSTWDVVKSV